MIGTWQPKYEDRAGSEELLVSFSKDREHRILILPAWFDEANKLRRFTIETMRHLDEAGFDVALPDLPGCNESLVPMDAQTLASWRAAVASAIAQFRITHVLSLRAGAMLAPSDMPGWRYAETSGAKMLNTILRARVIASREAGQHEDREALFEYGSTHGLNLAGWSLGSQMLRDMAESQPLKSSTQAAIDHAQIGASALWLRAEPDEDAAGAKALCDWIANDLNECKASKS